ncbi:MAG: c-type cytochrome [Kofleriaceae bacterium]
MPRTRVFVSVLALLVACSKPKPAPEEEPPPTGSAAATPTTPTGDPVAKAKTTFEQRCTPCHGATGAGDGPASASLTPKPRNYTDKEWQASVNDEYLEKIIKFGGAGVGKSPAMPNNPDLDAATITALKDMVRAFGK